MYGTKGIVFCYAESSYLICKKFDLKKFSFLCMSFTTQVDKEKKKRTEEPCVLGIPYKMTR